MELAYECRECKNKICQSNTLIGGCPDLYADKAIWKLVKASNSQSEPPRAEADLQRKGGASPRR